jgi:lipopolysaccharide biosynthesis glycosyltransferase
MKEKIHLLLTLDHNYLPQLKILLTSVALNNPSEKLSVHLLHDGISKADLTALSVWNQEKGYDFEAIYMGSKLFQNAPANKKYPKAMYYRLLAGQFLPETIKRVLYLDPDILIINPLRPLWEMDMEGKPFAAAAHTGKTELANHVNRIRLRGDHDYFNSGVLLIDLALTRKIIQPKGLFSYIETHRKELLLPDQDILNALYGKDILPINDALWNYDARKYNNYLFRSSGEQDMLWVMQHTAILHFCGTAKPWKPNYLYRFGLLYQHYMQLAGRDWREK